MNPLLSEGASTALDDPKWTKPTMNRMDIRYHRIQLLWFGRSEAVIKISDLQVCQVCQVSAVHLMCYVVIRKGVIRYCQSFAFARECGVCIVCVVVCWFAID